MKQTEVEQWEAENAARRIAGHRQAEKMRLDAGQSGCGCSVCQEFYKELDLTPYGRRVHNYEGFISIADKAVKALQEPESEIQGVLMTEAIKEPKKRRKGHSARPVKPRKGKGIKSAPACPHHPNAEVEFTGEHVSLGQSSYFYQCSECKEMFILHSLDGDKTKVTK